MEIFPKSRNLEKMEVGDFEDFFKISGILKKVGGRFVLSDDWLVFLLWGVPLVAWFGLVAKLRFLCLFLCEVLGRVMCLGV